jgi:hypothetical protein
MCTFEFPEISRESEADFSYTLVLTTGDDGRDIGEAGVSGASSSTIPGGKEPVEALRFLNFLRCYMKG